MNIIAVSVGSVESSAYVTYMPNNIGHYFYGNSLYILGDTQIVPTVLAESEVGDFYIPSSAIDFYKAKNIYKHFFEPIDTISPRNRIILKRYVKLLFKAIFSNINNPDNLKDGLVFINMDDCGHSSHQLEVLNRFLREECDVTVAGLVPYYQSLIYYFNNHLFDISKERGREIIINYTESAVELIANTGNSIVRERDSLGANLIDRLIFEYMLASNPVNRDHINVLKDSFPEHEIVERLLSRIKEWKYLYDNKQTSWLPEIQLSRLFYNQSYARLYFEGHEAIMFTESLYEEIISSYTIKLNETVKDFRSKLDTNQLFVVFLTGQASRLRFFHKIIEKIFNVSTGDSLFFDVNPSISLAKGTAIFGYESILREHEPLISSKQYHQF